MIESLLNWFNKTLNLIACVSQVLRDTRKRLALLYRWGECLSWSIRVMDTLKCVHQRCPVLQHGVAHQIKAIHIWNAVQNAIQDKWVFSKKSSKLGIIHTQRRLHLGCQLKKHRHNKMERKKSNRNRKQRQNQNQKRKSFKNRKALNWRQIL